MDENPDLTLDEIHEFMDGIELDINFLSSFESDSEKVRTDTLYGTSMTIGHFLHYWTAYGSGLPKVLRIPEKLLNKYSKGGSEIAVFEAKTVSAKLLSYLRSIEGEYNNISSSDNINIKIDENIEVQNKNFAFRAVSWVKNDSVAKSELHKLSISLDSLLTLAKSSNLPESEQALSDLEKAQLIAMLETALLILKAPLVEKGFLSKLRDVLAGCGKKVATKKTEEALGKLADGAAQELGSIIDNIPWDSF